MADGPVLRGRGGPRGMYPNGRGGSFVNRGGPPVRGNSEFRGRGRPPGRDGFLGRGGSRGEFRGGSGLPLRTPRGRSPYRGGPPTRGGPFGKERGSDYPSDRAPAPKRRRWDTPAHEQNGFESYGAEGRNQPLLGSSFARGPSYQNSMNYDRFDKPPALVDQYGQSSAGDMYNATRDPYSFSQEPDFSRSRGGAGLYDSQQGIDPYSRSRNTAGYGTSGSTDSYGTQRSNNFNGMAQNPDSYNRMYVKDNYTGSQAALSSYSTSLYNRGRGRTTPPNSYGARGAYTSYSNYEQDYDSGL
ncbi:RNA-binding motif protein, X chromosome-like isoform X2 [Limulus polyphemus]|uniref:RNA-binding motif protein, X chromosome-like isoform X2 n=1 Tax=Limulus polyphemus TaxID=6850 RepID=A0ABM1S0V6_LIMPO|nr:RNA-binding motif protein, X chromosome-like isoform X2 [Limulus polyphemus]